jgi:hypothetical protein
LSSGPSGFQQPSKKTIQQHYFFLNEGRQTDRQKRIATTYVS